MPDGSVKRAPMLRPCRTLWNSPTMLSSTASGVIGTSVTVFDPNSAGPPSSPDTSRSGKKPMFGLGRLCSGSHWNCGSRNSRLFAPGLIKSSPTICSGTDGAPCTSTRRKPHATPSWSMLLETSTSDSASRVFPALRSKICRSCWIAC